MKHIRDMQDFNKPREKIKEKGAVALSDAELVASILGSGNRTNDVMSLSAKVAKVIADTKGRFSREDIVGVNGIGEAKACQLLAAFELVRRYVAADTIKISRAEDVLPLLQDIAARQQEHFVCISLNGANEIIQKRIVTVGLLDRSQVHPREVFADAITDRAAAVIFAHNHPSGELRPSDMDMQIHNQLVEAAAILGIRVFDHVIVGKKGIYSFKHSGLIS